VNFRKFAYVQYVCGNGRFSALLVILLIFCLLIQNGDAYLAAELTCKQIAKSEEDLLDVYFLVTYFETVILCIPCCFLS